MAKNSAPHTGYIIERRRCFGLMVLVQDQGVTVDDDGLAGKIHKARGKGIHINCVFVCVCASLLIKPPIPIMGAAP